MAWARRSLFWTIAGLFVLTVVVGTLAQSLVLRAVLRPLEERDARGRAEIVASSVAAEIAADTRTPPVVDLDALLARYRGELGSHPAWLVYRARGGSVVSAPFDRGPSLEPLMASGKPIDLEPRHGEGDRPSIRVEIVARRSVVRGAEVLGEVAVVRPVRPRGEPGPLGRRTVSLFFPITFATSALAGLLIVRLLVRRLRALETLAARVAEGDFSVRIADRSGDEIGRLAERLDGMAERLARAREQLEQNDQQRRQLFADITHELATPLTSIRGYAETLTDPQVAVSDEERARYLHGVLEESQRLDRLIRDLFELARLEAGAVSLDKERLDWAALCRNTVERFGERFRSAQLSVRWAQPAAPAWVDADGRRLEQVLENLLVNALRYVPAGGTVEVSLVHSPDDPRRFRLTVADDGPGVSPEELGSLFQRFYRGAAAQGGGHRRVGLGSGLGLAIVHEIVQQHGGAVRAVARQPSGLQIVVELPAP